MSKELKSICEDISRGYEKVFIEMGCDGNHVHFLIQSLPTYTAQKICRMVKSITAREIFRRLPDVRKELWGEESMTLYKL